MKKNNSDLHVVGIGASAGGLNALKELFDHTPSNTGMAFVIIQHLSPDFVSLMPELLSKHTSMKIYIAQDKLTIKPNCIYLNERNSNLRIKGRELYLVDKEPKYNLNLPIDIFFHTLGEEYKEKSIGIILSGTGSDGSRGIKTIKEGGGVVMVQEPNSAQFNGMPNAALATKNADFILKPEDIGKTLQKLPIISLSLSSKEYTSKSSDFLIESILTAVYKHSGTDFREYKRNTLLRRIKKRMGINNIEELNDYYTFLLSNESEKKALKQSFLINVTRFFRDDEAFHLMETKIIPTICNSIHKSKPLRVWCAGCSTGEEVYSIAILIDQYIRAKKLHLDFKIFATDIDGIALNAASLGEFHINTVNEIRKEHLEQYFIKLGSKIKISKRIREKIVFSNHNVCLDPPFIKMDLITCRNLLIYLNNKVQSKIMKRFHFSLNKFGYLFLGNSESLEGISKKFRTIDVKWKIFQNINEEKSLISKADIYNPESIPNFKTPKRTSFSKTYNNPENPELVFHRYLSTKFSPDAIFIDKEYNIIFISGDAGKRLSHNAGLFQRNLLKNVSPQIATIIRNGIRRLESEQKDISIKDIVNQYENYTYKFDITIYKPKDNKDLQDTYVLEFSKNVKADINILEIKDVPYDEIFQARHEYLENELTATKTELQNVVEELETSNEELQSSNEELMASNEELQSTNEEFQSVNEALYTVNSELQEANKKLQLSTNDINNVFNSSEIGTLFLDTQLCIRRFTPSLKDLFNLEESDYGRPITTFASNFSRTIKDTILVNSKKALDEQHTIEEEVMDSTGNYYLVKISPYITQEKQIEGIVINFIDIAYIKKTETELKRSIDMLNISQASVKLGGWELDLITNNLFWTDETYRILDTSPEEHTPTVDDGVSLFLPKSQEIVSKALEEAIKTGKGYDLDLQIYTKKGRVINVRTTCIVTMNNGKPAKLNGVFQDITSQKNIERALTKAKEKAEESDQLKSAFLANMSHEIRTPMNGILGFTSLLQQPELKDEDKKTYVKIIEKSGNRMLNTVNDIINISKIETGQMEVTLKAFNISKEIENIYLFFKAEASKKGIALKLQNLIPKNEGIITSDFRKINGVFINLIKNALKFTDHGSIEITIDKKDKLLTSSIKDTGIGIPTKRLKAIFNRFTQADISDVRAFEGSGLGLTISKAYVELLGGKLWVESEVGIGTTFYFNIPIQTKK
ncbi:CheR family methyltransferase [Polaribacter litorisediminis]|uniref:CheR family methyltransferase n=1 Tax=Polaribacter litorisediminis TaxID=1908341 RepID=UPI001CBC02FB|nr:CheR family methyltransferase [Polaribacter litorisediminis]